MVLGWILLVVRGNGWFGRWLDCGWFGRTRSRSLGMWKVWSSPFGTEGGIRMYKMLVVLVVVGGGLGFDGRLGRFVGFGGWCGTVLFHIMS